MKTVLLVFALMIGIVSGTNVFAAKAPPSVTSPTVTGITQTTATLGGNILDTGGGNAITDAGIEWGTSSGGPYTTVSFGITSTGVFSQLVTGLPASTLIYFRAWADADRGADRGYSAESTFTTDSVTIVIPTVTSPTFSAVTDTTATLGGNVTNDGGESLSSKGVEWGTSSGSYTNDEPVTPGSTGTFTTGVTGFTPGTVIYFRAYAGNSAGTGYSGESSFTTHPTVSNPTIADVTDTTATLGGTVTSAVSVSNKGIEWGTAPGVYDLSVPTGSGGTGPFTQPVTGLPSGTVVYFHAWATNAGGTSYSSESSFTTKPTVSAPTHSAVTDSSAILGGTVSSDGGVTVTARGTVWGTSSNPTGNSLAEGTGNGTFTHLRTGLSASTLIYYRAYATNAAGTSYSADSQFTTPAPAIPPTVTTPTVASVTDTTAILGGNVTNDGGATVTNRGTVWGTSPSPSGNQLSEGPGTGTFSHLRNSLPPGTLIYFRAYATNSAGTSYSADGSFTTLTIPTVDTPTFASVTTTTAILGGNVSNDGGTPVTDRGTVWGLSPSPTGNSQSEGSGTGSFSQLVSGLPSGTLIYFRAYATNSVSTSYSADGEFTTLVALPTVDTPTSASITEDSAVLGGTVSNDGGGTITDRGTLWGISPSPTGNSLSEGSGTGTFSHLRGSLPTGTLIYFRAYATNSAGIAYSTDGQFTTLTPAVPPTVDTPTFASVTDTTAVLGGNVSADGGGTITQRGTVWGLAANPDIVAQAANVNVVAGTTGIFTGPVSGLPPGTLIHYRAFATNSAGTSYSADDSFTTTAPASPPTVDTPTFASVTATTAILGGTVSSDGGAPVTDRGTVWGLSPSPSGNIQSEGSGTGPFSHLVGSLPPGTQIYFRAYATNSAGTSYSDDGSFTTLVTLPTVDTPTFASVTTNSALLGGTVSDNGGAAVTDRGTVWGTSPSPGGNSLTEGSGTGTFSHSRTGLPPGTLIYFRAYATNSAGTAYSDDGSFTTSANSPTVDTPTFASVTTNSALLGATVSADGGAAVTDRGTVWGTSPSPTGNSLSEGSGTGTFNHSRTGLPAGTTIYFRGYAINSAGTAYSADGSFTTLVTLPTVNSPTYVPVDDTSATLGGNVSDDGGAPVTDRGTVWGLAPSPTGNSLSQGSGTGIFSHLVSGLPTDTLIYFRTYATNSEGTAYSADGSFTISASTTPPVLDTPTATSINYFSAILGGTITEDGGETITQRGTLWNLTGPPIIENQLSEGGITTGAFSHQRINLPRNTTIWYRAYATNSQGTGYTADASFVTASEPDVQASNIAFNLISSNSIRITWTKGNGEGSIVVIREAATGRIDPADGTDYTGNPDIALAPELPTSSGNFVVYNGTGISVQLYGLSQTTNYTIAVYTYAGSDTNIDYLAPPAEASQSTSDLPVHNTSYGAGCTDCHNHGGGGFVPRDAEQEAICVTCHNETGPASGKLNFALHTTGSGDVDCGSCHEIHNPNGATTSTHPLTPFTTTHNQSFIRSDVDKYVPSATPGEAVYQTPGTDLAIENASASEARGICQSCHSSLSYYNHDGSGDQCHDGASGNCDPITNGGTDCLGCHTHTGNFMPSGGSSCTGCHATEQGGGARRAIVGEFSLLSHHVAGTLADSDCEVCHAQSGAGATTHAHKDGSLTLWNVDNHNLDAIQLSDHTNPAAVPAEAAKLSIFCLNCHDSNGAAAEGSPFAPFSGSGAPPVVDSTHWGDSSHNTGGVSCYGDGSGGCHGSGHGSQKQWLLAPYNVAAIDPNRSEEREQFCFNCHSSTGMSSIDIEDQFINAATYQVTSAVGLAAINTKHDVLPSDQSYSGGLVTCKNCHQQHMNTDAAPVGDPDTGLALPLYDKTSTYTEDGNSLDYQDSSNDASPVNPLGQSGGPYTAPDYIQFCLACHDGTTPPGVTMTSGMGNMAVLYASDNHGPIAGNTGSKTGKGILKVPWNTQANYDAGDDTPQPYAAQNCTTCHGPHGGENIFNLRSSISVNGQALSVGGTGASFPGISGTTYTLPTDGGVQRDHYYGAWCTFCHTMDAHPGKGEADACTGAHQHGGGSF